MNPPFKNIESRTGTSAGLKSGIHESCSVPFPYAGMVQIRFQGVFSVQPFAGGTPLTVWEESTFLIPEIQLDFLESIADIYIHDNIHRTYTFMLTTFRSAGSREATFLQSLAGIGKNVFKLNDALEFWGGNHNARIAVHRLVRKGWLTPLERGTYLIVPLEAGKDRQWTEDPYVIAAALAHPAVIAYWSAIRHWGWTEQIPRILYVQTTMRKSRPKRSLLGVHYEFVTIPKAKIFGEISEWRGATQVFITSREKTLVDCADDVQRSGTIEELVKAVRMGLQEISWPTLHAYVTRFPNGAVTKRLGFLIEMVSTDLPAEAVRVLSSWRRNLHTGIVPLQPGVSRRGPISTRWRVQENMRVA